MELKKTTILLKKQHLQERNDYLSGNPVFYAHFGV